MSARRVVLHPDYPDSLLWHRLDPPEARVRVERDGKYIVWGYGTADELTARIVHQYPHADPAHARGYAGRVNYALRRSADAWERKIDDVDRDIRKRIGPYIRQKRSARAVFSLALRINLAYAADPLPTGDDPASVVLNDGPIARQMPFLPLRPFMVRHIVEEEIAWWMRLGEEEYAAEAEAMAEQERLFLEEMRPVTESRAAPREKSAARKLAA